MSTLHGWPPAEAWVEPALQARFPQEVFRRIAERICTNGSFPDLDGLVGAFERRERTGPTSMGRGYALPEAAMRVRGNRNPRGGIRHG